MLESVSRLSCWTFTFRPTSPIPWSSYGYTAARGELEDAYRAYRLHLGRALLLTLEFLIAADILETVSVDKTAESLMLLAGLVVVRTFLSFTLDLEIEGRWPWQSKREGEKEL